MTDGKTLIDTVDSDTLTSDPGAGIECGKVDAPAEVWVETPANGPRNAYLHCGSWPGDRTKYIRADLSQAAVEALEAKLAKAVGLLEAWIRVATHCTIEEGVCCCGAAMDTHDDPMSCGHLQVDHGAYVARGLVEETNATLAELTGGKDD